MKLLFFGDIIGQPGRLALGQTLQKWIKHYQADFVVGNAENAAHGKGLTPKLAEELWDMGFNVLTMGNHTLDKKEILPLLNDPRLLRPANYAPSWPGQGWGIYEVPGGLPIAVVQVMGRVYMPLTDCPFRMMDTLIEKIKRTTPIIFVDHHAEITAEKSAMGWHLDGRVSGVVGTHTHVQTADERVLPGGTAYLTDVGACGPINSVIGADIESSLKRFLTGQHSKMEVAPGDAVVCGCAIDIDETSGLARSIERIREVVPLSQ